MATTRTLFFFSSRRRHTRFDCDWSSDVCSSDLFTAALWMQQGALAAYGSDPYAEGIPAAGLVAKILKGAKVQELPIEGARKLVLAINKGTAAALGLRVPDELLSRADRVVE